VEVDAGNVTLKGHVPSYFARSSAYYDALAIIGVINVKNEITIDRSASVSPPPDEEIRRRIKNLFSLNLTIPISDVVITVNEGAVILEGSVDSFWKKNNAEELVAQEPGVVQVTNNLAIVPTRNRVDQSIAEDIVAAIHRNALISTEDIDVKVDGGSVTLTGTAATLTARKAAYDAALYTPGVIDIHDEISIFAHTT
jgi:osmotically-inducible protein OsmY